MKPNPTAQKNHDELFPNHVSTLAVTDPELIEFFDNFAFDEVLRESKLDVRTRLMVPRSVLRVRCSRGIEARLERALHSSCLIAGVTSAFSR